MDEEKQKLMEEMGLQFSQLNTRFVPARAAQPTWQCGRCKLFYFPRGMSVNACKKCIADILKENKNKNKNKKLSKMAHMTSQFCNVSISNID